MAIVPSKSIGKSFSLLVFICLIPLVCLSTETNDVLWEKSLSEVAKNGLRLPNSISYQSNLLDRTGKRLESFSASCKLGWEKLVPSVSTFESGGSKMSSGEVNQNVIRSDLEKTIHYLFPELPFFSDIPMTLIGGGSTPRTIEGIDCEGYQFKVNFESVSVSGNSWVDTRSALPRRVELWITNFEYASDDRKIIHFYRSIDYEISQNQIWRPLRITDNIWFIRRVMLKHKLFMEEKTFELKY